MKKTIVIFLIAMVMLCNASLFLWAENQKMEGNYLT